MHVISGFWIRRITVGILLLLPVGCFSRVEDNEVFDSAHERLIFGEEGGALKFNSDESNLLGILASLVGMTSGDIVSILSLARMGLGVVDTLYNIFTKVFNGTAIDFSFNDRPGADRQLLSIFEIVTLRLEQIQRGVSGTEASLRDLVRGLPHMVRWEIALDTLESYIKPINNLYHRFAYYQQHKMEVENHTLLDFATSVVSHDTDSIQSLMANIHSMATPNDPPVIRGARIFQRDEYEVHNRVTSRLSSGLRKLLSTRYSGHVLPPRVAKAKMEELSLRPSIFNMLEEAIKNYNSCSQKQSPQQLIFGLYTLIAITQARGYAMVTFALNLLKYHNKGNFTIERQLADELYTHYSYGLLNVGKKSLARASNAFRKCDPQSPAEGETFVMITELLQGYIENEVDLNSRGTCGNKCSDFQHATVVGCFLPDKQYCGKHRRCKGTVHECRFFDADAHVCISSDQYRRYDWIKYENNQLLGKEDTCANLMKVDSWWRFFYHCSYCVCLCDDFNSPTTERYISLKPVVSDVANNKVITGIRFTKVNRILHMQVQEGTAIAQGQIDGDSLKWVNVEPMSTESTNFKDGTDYITLKYETRNIDLDHLKAPKGHVVTGVRFRMLGQHINLEMWVTPANFTSGILKPDLSFWVSNDNTPVMAQSPRKELKLVDPDDPRRTVAESQMDSHTDMYVQLQASSMHADVAQLTVPFFDAQPVAPEPASWLEGLQLYHRGSLGFGGYIAFQAFNYNLTQYLEDPEEEGGLIVL